MKLLKLKEVAAWLNCSLSNVYARVADGTLPVHLVGKTKGFRVAEGDLAAYLAAVRHEGAGEAPPQALRHIRLPGGSP